MGDKVTMAGSKKKGSYIVVGKTSQGHALVLSSGGEAGRTSSAPSSALTHTGKRNTFYAKRPVAIDSMDRTKPNISSGGSGGGVSAKVTKGVGTSIGLKAVGGKELKMGDKVTMAGSKKGSYIVVGKTSKGGALLLSSGSEKGSTSGASASSLTHTGKRNKYYARRPVVVDSMNQFLPNMW